MAWSLRTRILQVTGGDEYTGNRWDWWDKTDESQEWQRDIFYFLCASYALVSFVALKENLYVCLNKHRMFTFVDSIEIRKKINLVTFKNPEHLPLELCFDALLVGSFNSLVLHLQKEINDTGDLIFQVQLVRIQLRVPEYGWTTQKVFHLLNFIVNGLRAILFGLYKNVFLIKPKVLELVLLDLPSLLFLSTYSLLLLFWAEIYHQARTLPTEKLRPAYYIINGVIYLIQVCMWIAIASSRSPVAQEVAKLFFSVISLCIAIGFLIYGGRLFVMLRRFPIESRGRQKKLYEVSCVTGVCCTCFLIRCVVSALSAFNHNADLDVLNHPLLNLIYYTLVEIVPSGLVLFILRKLPPKRISNRYHPIR